MVGVGSLSRPRRFLLRPTGAVLRYAVAPRASSWLVAVILRRLLRVTSDEPLGTLIERAQRHPVFELRSQLAAA